jgi:hypothetical protein
MKEAIAILRALADSPPKEAVEAIQSALWMKKRVGGKAIVTAWQAAFNAILDERGTK